jgi:ferrous iron transport protein B
MATFAVTWKESGSLKWAMLQFGGLTLLAWIITTVIYQAGRLIGIGI